MGKVRINTAAVGLALLAVYTFFSYNAVDIWFPLMWKSVVLYAFLAFGAFAFFMGMRRARLRLPVYTVWYAVFMAYSLLIMLYSPEKRILAGEFYLMIVSLVLTFFTQYFIRTERDFEILCWVQGISSLVLNLSLILTGNMTADASNRLGGDIMGNANTFANMIMIAVIYLFWLLLYTPHKWPVKLLVVGMLAVDYYSLILSAGRKFFVIPLVVFYILLLFKRDKTGRRHILKYTVYIGLLVILCMYLLLEVPLFYETIGYRFESYILGLLGEAEQGASAAIREEMQILALEKWLESPIWGYGFDSFKYYCLEKTGHFFYSHCNYTELLYNGGIIYFAVFYWIYWYLWRNVFLLKRGKNAYRAFAAGILVSFLLFDYGAVSYSIEVNNMIMAAGLKMLFVSDPPTQIKQIQG